MTAEQQVLTRKRFKKTSIIKLLCDANPKRKGSLAHQRFELYKDDMTIGEYLDAGGRTGDIHYDIAAGLIEVVEA